MATQENSSSTPPDSGQPPDPESTPASPATPTPNAKRGRPKKDVTGETGTAKRVYRKRPKDPEAIKKYEADRRERRSAERRIKRNKLSTEMLDARKRAELRHKAGTLPVSLKLAELKERTAKGQKPYAPTIIDRSQVAAMAATGALKIEHIASLVINPKTGLPISVMTLRKHYSHELDTSLQKANAKVAEAIFLRATKGGRQDMSAAMWWEKTRTGMKETVSVEVEDKSGVLVSPAGKTPAEWLQDAAERAAAAEEPPG